MDSFVYSLFPSYDSYLKENQMYGQNKNSQIIYLNKVEMQEFLNYRSRKGDS
jgi:hypothetical protein